MKTEKNSNEFNMKKFMEKCSVYVEQIYLHKNIEELLDEEGYGKDEVESYIEDNLEDKETFELLKQFIEIYGGKCKVFNVGEYETTNSGNISKYNKIFVIFGEERDSDTIVLCYN